MAAGTLGPMADPLLLLPDLLLIVCGYVICHYTPLNQPVWEGVERLVYHVLFPALLFTAIVRSPQQVADMLPLAGASLVVTVVGVALALALGHWPGVDARLHASGAQTAYRFNTYVALALSERIAGAQGLAWIALIVALSVPVTNVAAVWSLARHGDQGTLRQLLRNPLILATSAGLLCKLVDLTLPALALNTAARIGSAALPLGLMAVGAGLRLGALREGPRLAVALLSIRHAVLPLLAMALVVLLGLPPAQQAVGVAFAAMPCAPSAYVLAVRMGGHGPFVAGLVTVSTLIAMAGLPLSLALLRQLTSG